MTENAASATSRAQRTATTIGVVTTVIGGVLLWAPDGVARALGTSRPGQLRIIGLADLALVPGLIAGRPRWPWVAARAALNVAIAAYLVDDARSTRDPRPRRIALLLTAITVGDCATARRLRADERKPGRLRD